ncbi:MAG: hypothetical protein D6696_10885 [Acidobacteria bacterium]|nr:MAG: hypothetical protein D6696_10885 [Acidobacteriota bacterium]
MRATACFFLLLLLPALAAAQVPLRVAGEPGAQKIHPELLAAMEAAALAAYGKASPLPRHRVIVTLRSPPADDERASLAWQQAEARRRAGVRAAQRAVLDGVRRGSFRLRFAYRLLYGFSGDADAEWILDCVKRREVVAIEAMPVFFTQDRQAHRLLRAGDMHRLGATGDGVTIAIIDDGIDHDHAAFGGQRRWPNAKVIGGYDVADLDDDPRIDCREQDHGTAVAGLAAGNGGGVLGTAPDARLVVLKAQSRQVCGFGILDGDVAAAIDWAIDHRRRLGIRVISMSFGGRAFSSRGACNRWSPAIRNAAKAAQAAGITLLASAGNGGAVGQLSNPACMSRVISVGAVFDADVGPFDFFICSHEESFADLVACYSNSASFLDVLAPAHCARTARAERGRQPCFGGTSAAAPYAAGVVASLLEANPSLSHNQVRRLLRDHGVLVTDPKSGITTPRLDALAALAAVGAPPPGGGGEPPPPSAGSELRNRVPVEDLDGAAGDQRRFTLEVPAGASNLRIRIDGGSGNADLYVRFGARPTGKDWDCRPARVDVASELCRFERPQAGTWHVMVRGRSDFAGVRLVARFDGG